jgi:hypothetical protein
MKGEINKMEYLLQIGKTFGFSALILFAIGWFIDIIKIATGSFRDNSGAPLRQ